MIRIVEIAVSVRKCYDSSLLSMTQDGLSGSGTATLTAGDTDFIFRLVSADGYEPVVSFRYTKPHDEVRQE